jgi:hypothetical protein
MREEQIKILEQMRDAEKATADRMHGLSPDNAIAQMCFERRDALTAAISYIRDTSEIEKAARYALATLRSFDEKYFFDDSDYHLLSETAIEKLESALDAYREVKEKR